MSYPAIRQFIAGDFQPVAGTASSVVLNPADGETLGELPHVTTAQLDLALEAAKNGFETWRKVSARDRGRVIANAATLLRERIEEVARALTLEQGKTINEARQEITLSIETLEWDAAEAQRRYGRIIPARNMETRQLVLREPVGPVLALTPWNFPAVTPVRKVSAALAAGCSCILKPAEETPGVSIMLAQIFKDAGLPDGVLNVVTGDPDLITRHLLGSGVIRKLSFTGSVSVGKHLMKLAADHVVRCTMELGGHAPVLVFEDADIDRAALAATASKFRNAGQICISPTRFYIQESVYKKFVEAFAVAARAITVGNGMDPSTSMGPLANERRISTLARLISDGVDKGARVRLGGSRLGNRGNFFEPTILSDVNEDADAMNEEPFGPLAVMAPFRSTEDALRQANRLEYGLASYVFTRSSKTVAQAMEGIEAGMIGVNSFAIAFPEAPFGGIKHSGFGSEGGTEGLEAFERTKFVSHVEI